MKRTRRFSSVSKISDIFDRSVRLVRASTHRNALCELANELFREGSSQTPDNLFGVDEALRSFNEGDEPSKIRLRSLCFERMNRLVVSVDSDRCWTRFHFFLLPAWLLSFTDSRFVEHRPRSVGGR